MNFLDSLSQSLFGLFSQQPSAFGGSGDMGLSGLSSPTGQPAAPQMPPMPGRNPGMAPPIPGRPMTAPGSTPAQSGKSLWESLGEALVPKMMPGYSDIPSPERNPTRVPEEPQKNLMQTLFPGWTEPPTAKAPTPGVPAPGMPLPARNPVAEEIAKRQATNFGGGDIGLGGLTQDDWRPTPLPPLEVNASSAPDNAPIPARRPAPPAGSVPPAQLGPSSAAPAPQASPGSVAGALGSSLVGREPTPNDLIMGSLQNQAGPDAYPRPPRQMPRPGGARPAPHPNNPMGGPTPGIVPAKPAGLSNAPGMAPDPVQKPTVESASGPRTVDGMTGTRPTSGIGAANKDNVLFSLGEGLDVTGNDLWKYLGRVGQGMAGYNPNSGIVGNFGRGVSGARAAMAAEDKAAAAKSDKEYDRMMDMRDEDRKDAKAGRESQKHKMDMLKTAQELRSQFGVGNKQALEIAKLREKYFNVLVDKSGMSPEEAWNQSGQYAQSAGQQAGAGGEVPQPPKPMPPNVKSGDGSSKFAPLVITSPEQLKNLKPGTFIYDQKTGKVRYYQ